MTVPERERGGKGFHLIGSVARACASDDGRDIGGEGERERLGGAPLGGRDAARDFEGTAREGPVEFVGDTGTQRGLVGDLRILLLGVIFVGNGKTVWVPVVGKRKASLETQRPSAERVRGTTDFCDPVSSPLSARAS